MILDIQAKSLEEAQAQVLQKHPRRGRAYLVLGETPHTVRLAVEAKLNRAKQSKQYRDQALKLQGIIQNLDKAVRAGKHSSVVVAEAMIAHGDMRTEKADGFAYIQVGQAARWLAFSRI